jgi:hypothetical protein
MTDGCSLQLIPDEIKRSSGLRKWESQLSWCLFSRIVFGADRDAIYGFRLDDIKQKLTRAGRANYKFAMKSFFIFGALPPLSMQS